ncbi:MAG: heavy-metal-associated domain-containing protein [Proteobacteria bacterium]|nr:heavy-metal-associated domain-containing protein [Pseudomonadota bacterium]
MKYWIALAMISLSIAVNADARQLEYDLDVKGMKCAFCAYNVSKQLESLAGVVPGTVDVDLEQGTVNFRSEKTLDETQLADLLLQAGFTLETVAKEAASVPQPGQVSNRATFLSLTMNAQELTDGAFDALLKELGTIAVQRSGRVSVVGPGALEVAILKPVLGGRRSVIKVDYERVNQPDQAVIVSVSAATSSQDLCCMRSRRSK